MEERQMQDSSYMRSFRGSSDEEGVPPADAARIRELRDKLAKTEAALVDEVKEHRKIATLANPSFAEDEQGQSVPSAREENLPREVVPASAPASVATDSAKNAEKEERRRALEEVLGLLQQRK